MEHDRPEGEAGREPGRAARGGEGLASSAGAGAVGSGRRRAAEERAVLDLGAREGAEACRSGRGPWAYELNVKLDIASERCFLLRFVMCRENKI